MLSQLAVFTIKTLNTKDPIIVLDRFQTAIMWLRGQGLTGEDINSHFVVILHLNYLGELLGQPNSYNADLLMLALANCRSCANL